MGKRRKPEYIDFSKVKLLWSVGHYDGWRSAVCRVNGIYYLIEEIGHDKHTHNAVYYLHVIPKILLFRMWLDYWLYRILYSSITTFDKNGERVRYRQRNKLSKSIGHFLYFTVLGGYSSARRKIPKQQPVFVTQIAGRRKMLYSSEERYRCV